VSLIVDSRLLKAKDERDLEHFYQPRKRITRQPRLLKVMDISVKKVNKNELAVGCWKRT
jgi:hypothetical protein